MSQPLFFLEDTARWKELGGGMRRSIRGYNDQIMLVKVAFERGSIGALHSHLHAQSSIVESGLFEVTIGGEKAILKAGDGFFAPPDVEHGVLALEPGVIIDVFSPARTDFL